MAQMHLQKIPSLKEELIWQELEDGTVIVTVDEGKVRVLNEAGTLIWSMIDGQHTLQQMAERLAQSYRGLSLGKAEEDVTRFFDSLASKGLILVRE